MRNVMVCIMHLLLIGVSAQAWDVVNVNFQNSSSGPVEDNGDAAFGSSAVMTWNNFIKGTAILSNLYDSTGTVTSVSVSPNITTGWYTSTFFNSLTYGQDIMGNYLFVQNATVNMTVGGLTAGYMYDVYLYGHGDNENQNTTFTINGVSKACTTNVSALTVLTENAHYVVFRNIVADASGQIIANWGNTGNYSALNGLQIVRVTVETKAENPIPYSGEYMTNSPTALNWTNPLPLDGTSSITCTVYLGITSNRANMDSVILAPNASSVQINSANFPNYGVLQRGIDYYWIVDCIDASSGANPVNGLGEPWMFHNYLPDWDGFGGQATGGAGGTMVTVGNFTNLRNYAESAASYIIRVSGTIDMGAGGQIQCKPNKTIEGVDRNATVIGNIQIGSNSIVRNLNITNPYRDSISNAGADALTVWGVNNVMITHCSIYDAYDGLCDITQSSNNITVSWCKFYYTDPSQTHRFTMISGNVSDSHPHITLHHNWWAQNCDQRMPSGSWNTVHMYNNYFTCTGNYYCSNVRDGGEMLSENNYYLNVNNPVTVSLPPADGNPAGLIKTVGNTYISCTGTIYSGKDTIFTPTYAYTPDAVMDVPSIVKASAGNRLYGDFDGDNDIDTADLELFVDFWQSNNRPAFYQDLNDDGTVSLYEFSQFAQSWLVIY